LISKLAFPSGLWGGTDSGFLTCPVLRKTLSPVIAKSGVSPLSFTEQKKTAVKAGLI
jgi:hypothetical protein